MKFPMAHSRSTCGEDQTLVPEAGVPTKKPEQYL